MPISVDLSVHGDVQVSRRIVRFSEHAADARPAWRQIIRDLEGIEARQFASEGRYGSGGWEPLAESTLARKHGGRILVDTGALLRSLTERAAPGAIREIHPDWMQFGTGVPYAGFHQHGTKRMPARKPVELPESDRRRVVKSLQRFLMTGHAA